MRKLIMGTIAVISLTAVPMLVAGSANAQSRGGAAISLNFGNIAFGYSDGYWDNSHRWHRWSNANEQRRYQKQRGKHYDNHRHDQDKDHGWHRR